MGEYLLGSLLLVPYNFVPRGWAPCKGQLLSIQQNVALFSLLGNQYGGDGQSTFGLPNLTMTDANGVPLTWIICVSGFFPERGE